MARLQRSAKRIYSPSALEFWFQKLGEDWEPHFSESALARGRDYYTSGIIREVELGAEDAIIHCKVEKEAFYALIEWDGPVPKIRGSLEATDVNEAVAAAGFYEIEELVADEVKPLGPTSVDGSSESRGTGEAGHEGTAPTASAPVDLGPRRHLELDLSGSEQGLVVEPYWMNGTRKRVPALKEGIDPGPASDNGVGDREELVRLTGMAHKAGFEYRSAKGDFLLKDAKRIPRFLSENLQNWQKVFSVALDPEAERLQRGVQRAKLVGKAKTGETRDRMEIRWHLQVGEHLLTDGVAHKLARRGSGINLVPGIGLVELGEAEAEAIEEWQAFTREGGGGEWPNYMLLSLFAESVDDLDLEGSLEEWLSQVEGSTDTLWNPPGFLRDYQQKGVEWMAGQCELGCHILLADEMGLGKTLQVLGLIHSRPLEGEASDAPHLIVCPASVVPVWRNEIQRFFPAVGIEELKSGHDFEEVAAEGGTIWIASYTQLRRHKHQLGKARFGYAVLDEAQQIKNPDAKVSQACMQIDAAHRIALTGTPLENRQLDLWSLFRYLMPGLLGSRRRFEEKVAADRTGEFRSQLSEQIRPFILRRTKQAVVRELPPKVEMDLSCPLSDLQVKRYRSLTESALTELGDSIESAVHRDSMHFFALLTRLRQVCCDPGLLPGEECDPANSGKIQSLLGKVEEVLESGSKAVIFSQFTGFIDRIHEALGERFPTTPIHELTGQTRDRDRPVQAFQEGVGAGLMLVSLRAGGVGITLHAADYVFLMDPWWNPAVEAQAIDRVHRIGQEKPVFVYRMVTEGTIESRIMALKQEKKDLFDRMLGDLEGVKEIRESFQSLSELVSLEAGDRP